MTDNRSGDLFGRYDPSGIQILTWVAIGLLLNFAAEPLVVPYFGASMAIISTFLFVRNDYPQARTLAWTIPTAVLFVASAIGEGWTWALLTYAAMLLHGAFYLVPPLRRAWYGGPA
jgi:hypothetical protein